MLTNKTKTNKKKIDESKENPTKNFYTQGKNCKFDLDKITKNNALEIFTGVLYALRTQNNEKIQDCTIKIEAFLDKWYGDRSFLKELRYNNEFDELIDKIEKLILKDLSVEDKIRYHHLFSDKEILDSQDDIIKIAQSDISLAYAIIDRIEDKDALYSEKTSILFLLDPNNFDKLSEYNKHKIAISKDEKLKEIKKEKFPSLDLIYKLNYETIKVIAQAISYKRRCDNKVTLKEIALASNLVFGKEKNDQSVEILTLFDTLGKKEINFDLEKDLSIAISYDTKLQKDAVIFLEVLKTVAFQEGIFSLDKDNLTSDEKNSLDKSSKIIIELLEALEKENLIDTINDLNFSYADLKKEKSFEEKRIKFIKRYILEEKKDNNPEEAENIKQLQITKEGYDKVKKIVQEKYCKEVFYKAIKEIKDESNNEEKNNSPQWLIHEIDEDIKDYERDQASQGTLQTLLYIAKGLVVKEKQSESNKNTFNESNSEKTITLEHIKKALSFLFIDGSLDDVNLKLLNILSPDKEENEKNAKDLIELAFKYEKKIKYDDSVKVLKDKLDKKIGNNKIFTYKKPEKELEVIKDHDYYKVITDFAKALYDKDQYKDSLPFWEKIYEDEKDFNSLFYIVNSHNNLKEYTEIIKYEKEIQEYSKKLDDEDFKKEPIGDSKTPYSENNKRELLVLVDSLITAYRETKQDISEDNPSLNLLKKIIDTSKDIVDSQTIQFYALPVYKYIWLLKQKKDEETIKNFKSEHDTTIEEIFKRSDKELCKELKSNLGKFVKDADSAEKKKEMKEKEMKEKEMKEKEMKEKENIYKEYFIEYCDNKKLEDSKKGDWKTLFILAKAEAIDADTHEIKKEHLENASKYLCLTEDGKKLFDDNDLEEKTKKETPTDEQFLKAIKHDQINFDKAVKEFRNSIKEKEKIYFEISKGQCNEENPKSEIIEVKEKITQIDNDKQTVFTKKEMKEYTSKDIILLSKYLAIKEQADKITIPHLKQALSSFEITDEKLSVLLPKSAGIVRKENNIDQKIKKAEDFQTIKYDKELKEYNIFKILNDQMDKIVAQVKL